MFDPVSTYRIQFHKGFTFKDFLKVIPYLEKLGIKTVYASPIYEAVPGSMHGYDVVNPSQINPEIGTIDELREISAQLKSLNMNWIQDIVPNHMGFHERNTWLMDVLKNGEDSAYRSYFDLISTNLEEEPLMVPFLGDDLDTVIGKRELELTNRDGDTFLKYYDSHWPLKPGSAGENLDVKTVAAAQYYRLCCHKETNSAINYRRFFTVNSLICLNIQYQKVFDDYHKFTKLLLDEGIFQGLRIDHVDGLADPTSYLEQLRALCGEETYIVVEKILEPGEELPATWPVQGTTGYDYLGLVNQLFTNDKAERRFDTFYKKLGRHSNEVHQLILKKKRSFLDCYMQGELDNLYNLLFSLELIKSDFSDDDAVLIKEVLSELLVRCPVYRFYSNHYPLLPSEFSVLQGILDDIEESDPRYSKAVALLRTKVFPLKQNAQNAAKAIVFFKRLMQFTGPLMAKGVEDTLMYTYNRFIGNNEVGDSPEIFGLRADVFHEQISARQKAWPNAMNTTATHDTKRGEDARTRLTVLTDLRKEWIAEVKEWQGLNAGKKKAGSPDANDEYFIYQTLVATYPEGDPAAENYEERVLAYIEKALRESKRNSEWDQPDLEYEAHTKEFIKKLLEPEGEFWQRFHTFHKKVAEKGRIASLSSLILKHTLPGVPDTYQGTEFWDLSMVDPDNRRAVDYDVRTEVLNAFSLSETAIEDLWNKSEHGHIKLYFLHRLLHVRQQHPQLFSKGLYIPLDLKGKHAENVIAFARRYRNEWLVVVAAVNFPGTEEEIDWEDTRIGLPEALPKAYTDVLNKKEGEMVDGMKLSAIFDGLPMAVFYFSQPEQKRGAGVLMHISSLPSAYGIGDIGASARRFLTFLANAGLKYWQVLPMNPISQGQEYSPYSATSVMAGNTLLISPDDLYEEGLISSAQLDAHKRKVKRNVSYAMVNSLKNDLLRIGYKNWTSKAGSRNMYSGFEKFCRQEAFWLDDYAQFVFLGEIHGNTPWYEWPSMYRDRQLDALKDLTSNFVERLEEIKWQQYIFYKQWGQLKEEALVRGIKLIGDLPFYTALDSADVWTHRKLFSLDKRGQVKGMAGVPPDYFNADGQLWGMPVYDWQAIKRSGYKWWIDRIAKNFELYDLLRLDHFRAFASYWEVPAGNDTAKDGRWAAGPGADFFKALQAKFDSLPFIAEDLGEITEDVYELRDRFALPGMKVLQFAFGEDIGQSLHAPHNYPNRNCIVYTGTHDNNTTRGWFEEEADKGTRNRIEKYLGVKVTKETAVKQLIRAAFASVADVAIIPMQDLLNKAAKSRMNTPASTSGNWTWRLKPEELSSSLTNLIRLYKDMYGR